MLTLLVIGNEGELRDVLDLLLLGRASVRWVSTTQETEGLGVDVVLISGPYGKEELGQVRVHPRLRHVPVVLLGKDPVEVVRNLWVIDAGRSDAIDEITQRLSWLLARVCHPTYATHGSQKTPAA